MSVTVGSSDAGPAQVKQVPRVGHLVPAARVVQHLEVRDTSETGTRPETQHSAVIGAKQKKK